MLTKITGRLHLMSKAKYIRWKDTDGTYFRPVSITGTDLLSDRTLNKGTAFTEEERKEFDLIGLLPPKPQTFEAQLRRVYEGFLSAETDIKKYTYLKELQGRNETLFYALVSRHLDEMTPIIYTPTVGKACQEFSHRYQKTRGMFITQDNVGHLSHIAKHFDAKDIKIIVVTDSKAILGIGDQGVGGMGIPVGKLSLYTLGAGIHPAACLPITLDIGTDNEELLNDPMYLGERHNRITGKAYEEFIETFVQQVKIAFPGAVLQWEDFSKSDAFDNLNKYKDQLPSFNDDIQGTGSVVLAGVLGATRIKKESLQDQVFAIYGAGAGGVGVADQIQAGLVRDGLTTEEAKDRIYILDSQGLVLDDRDRLDDFKLRYAKSRSTHESWSNKDKLTLDDLLSDVPVTVLIGTSGVAGAFKEHHIKAMLQHCKKPMVFPLSNPTSNSEAIPEDIFNWSKGQAIVATGSPYKDVEYEGKSHRIGQGNNVFIFPGVGLAAILAKVKQIEIDMFTTASFALSECITEEDLAQGAVYPEIHRLREISAYVAKAVMIKELHRDPTNPFKEKDLDSYIEDRMWVPEYLPYKKV